MPFTFIAGHLLCLLMKPALCSIQHGQRGPREIFLPCIWQDLCISFFGCKNQKQLWLTWAKVKKLGERQGEFLGKICETSQNQRKKWATRLWKWLQGALSQELINFPSGTLPSIYGTWLPHWVPLGNHLIGLPCLMDPSIYEGRAKVRGAIVQSLMRWSLSLVEPEKDARKANTTDIHYSTVLLICKLRGLGDLNVWVSYGHVLLYAFTSLCLFLTKSSLSQWNNFSFRCFTGGVQREPLMVCMLGISSGLLAMARWVLKNKAMEEIFMMVVERYKFPSFPAAEAYSRKWDWKYVGSLVLGILFSFPFQTKTVRLLKIQFFHLWPDTMLTKKLVNRELV